MGKASLTVQQYFELKMKEKKSKSTLVESSEPFSASTANDGGENTEKGANEVSPSDVENNNVDSSATKKSKKNKKAEDIPTLECEKTESGNDVEGESERKKKKKKLEDGSKKAEVNATEMDQAEPPKKKKKKK